MIKKIITMLKNIKFLFNVNLAENNNEIMYQTQLRVLDLYKYEIKEDEQFLTNDIKVLNNEETVDLLMNRPKSFCRLGDGEIELIKGNSIPFQKKDQRLSQYLLNILKAEDTWFYIGINYRYFHSTRNLNETNRRFYLTAVKKYRDFIIENCNKNNTFIAAGFNLAYVSQREFDFGAYYEKIKNLFNGKKIVLFVGRGLLKTYKHDVFEYAEQVIVEEGPNINAFSEFDSLLERALTYDKSHLMCFILGPTSKALVYELAQKGYMAWDVGHLAKDYNAYCEGMERSHENIVWFYSPD